MLLFALLLHLTFSQQQATSYQTQGDYRQTIQVTDRNTEALWQGQGDSQDSDTLQSVMGYDVVIQNTEGISL